MDHERLSVTAKRLQFLASDTSLLRDSECIEELRAIVVDCRRWAATGDACQLKSQGVLKLLLLLVSDPAAPDALPTDVRLKILQTMANAMTCAPEIAPFFVEELQKAQLLAIIDHNPAPVVDVFCYLLYLCCKGAPEFVDRMPCVVHELSQIKSMEHEWSNLGLLLTLLVFDMGLATKLIWEDPEKIPESLWVLEVLCYDAASLPARQSGGDLLKTGIESLEHLVSVGQHSWEVAKREQGLQRDLVAALLSFFRALFTREDEGRALSLTGQPLAAGLQSAGALGLILDMLRYFPIGNDQTESATVHSLKTDVLAVLANALCGRPEIQDAVLASGVLPNVLASTKSDHAAPMSREWALMAVRNICEDNVGAQKEIDSLKLEQTLESQIKQTRRNS